MLRVKNIETKTFCYEVKGHTFCSQELYWDNVLGWDKENIRQVVQITTALVKEAYNFANRNNKEFFVVLIPSKEMVYGPLVKENKRCS